MEPEPGSGPSHAPAGYLPLVSAYPVLQFFKLKCMIPYKILNYSCFACFPEICKYGLAILVHVITIFPLNPGHTLPGF